ncbi:MAG: hypothetical protein ACPGXK_01940 [Phycisphaerae bacterium]
MPRPNKAFRRQKINAAIEYKRGNREEAYKLWEEAAKSTREHREKKQNKNKPAEAEGESSSEG